MQVLLLIIGDDHTVVAWYVCRSESWKELTPGLLFLCARLERLGTLHMLQVWWSDRCCDGAHDVTQHLLVTIFPGITRAPYAPPPTLTLTLTLCNLPLTSHLSPPPLTPHPSPRTLPQRYRDCFHAINAVNKTGHEGLPDQKAELGSDCFKSMRYIPEEELKPPISWLKRSRKYDESKARAVALADFRRTGIIRNRSFGSKTQQLQWRAVRAKWASRKKLALERKERSVIRSKSGMAQGTLEEMDAVERCIIKGCLVDPWPMEDMYVDTVMQPKTRLQERLRLGDTNRNEARHRPLNEIVEHVSRLGADLMNVELDVKLFLTNRKYDVLFGRIDAHSLGCFPWNDEALDALGADLLEGPPLFPRATSPFNALPKLKPVRKGDPEWEPLGFRYLDYLVAMKDNEDVAAALAAAEAALAEKEEEARCQQCEAEGVVEAVAEALAAGSTLAEDSTAEAVVEADAEITAEAEAATTVEAEANMEMVAPSPAPSPARSPARSSLARQGGVRWSNTQKTMHVTPALTEAIEPRSEAEVKLMAECITQAIGEGRGRASMAMYDRASDIYRERLTVYFKHPTQSPPDGMRYNQTSGPRIKASAERCTRVARQAVREREYRGVAEAGDEVSTRTATEVAALIEAQAAQEPAAVQGAAVVQGVEAAQGAEAALATGEFSGGLIAADPDHIVMDPVAFEAAQRLSRKRDSDSRRAAESRRTVKKQTVTVMLADLKDHSFRIGDRKQRRLAQAAGVRQRVDAAGGAFTAQHQRDAIIAYMERLALPALVSVAGDAD